MSAAPTSGSVGLTEAPATRRRRVLLAKTALDGHWRGLSLVARALRDDGFEVVMLGMATDEEIARAAADEDVDLIGLNVGGRIEVVERIIGAVRDACGGVPVFAGGAIAPWAAERLGAAGVESYPPGSALGDIVAAARRLTGLEPAARLHQGSESGGGAGRQRPGVTPVKARGRVAPYGGIMTSVPALDPGELVLEEGLLRRYDVAGPRYTSYPTALEFHPGFGAVDYERIAARTHAAGGSRALSLYVHLPFCATVCYYCACNKIVTNNRARAAPYLERLHREIVLQSALYPSSRPVRQLHWGGGTPTFLSDRELGDLMEHVRRHFTLLADDAGEYSIEIDPRELRDGTLATLRACGFNRLSIGVQDLDPQVQRAVNRIQSEAQTFGAIEAAHALGFRSVNVDLIYGLPHQTPESFARTVERVLAAQPDRLSVFNYAHLPQRFNTQRQIETSAMPAAPVKLAILRRTAEQLAIAGYSYIGMDHFARPDDELAVAQRAGRLQRNFQGYSTHGGSDLVGLGVSAIGSVDGCYYQNAHRTEDYFAALGDGRLPIVRGIELTDDDRLRRHVIGELICQFRLDFRAFERVRGIGFEDRFGAELAALAPMEADGLLAVDEGGIEVLPRGRPLIRNICMVFDRYLSGPAKEQRFSRVI